MEGLFLLGSIAFCLISKVVAHHFNNKSSVEDVGNYRYFINNKKSLVHPLEKSYRVLDISDSTLLSPKVIHNAFEKQLEFAKEDKLLGYKRKYEDQDYEAAKQYLIDYYEYVAYSN